MAKTFLKAEWRKLAMANYVIDPDLLASYLPHKTELDLWNGKCYVSLVGFMFLNTKLKGLPIPFHTNFEEVNLRFYVRHKAADGWKRGVVFVKEIVPRPALTFVANTVYNENYETMRMDHSCQVTGDELSVEYKWKKEKWNSFRITAENQLITIGEGSDEEFITEHYWGYTKLGEHKTSEYEVTHPRWQVYPVKEYNIDVDFENVYGKEFGFLKDEKPESVFLAEGSVIEVKAGNNVEMIVIES
ncbi:YqjF family protein [Pinibacter aurantiacus]|uniref:DUF2071 domain-containing protein n=1 Tax=Pinibacter aurantiacus TaxID=2851599 RepID=A0A9E2W845_9BACT|nr:DUF2071 domain-containing protein [Pinibacter aurantiacus]MBV4357901.1 DUF2071 domain-containing protein [Pinibacter aurantiacus]